jgi:hypothetical protein
MTPEEADAAARKHYAEFYEVLARHPFVADRPILLADHPREDRAARRCRFCLRGEPEAAFESVAHAVPEFLGNKAILSLNECDDCNARFATEYEDHLSKWSLFARSVSQVRGKKKKPTFKNPSETLRVGAGASGLEIRLTDPGPREELVRQGEPFSFTLPADATSQPHVPVRAAMALVKIACSVCPADELAQCRRAIDWLLGRVAVRFSKFFVLYAFTPGPINEKASEVILLRRKRAASEPYLWCVVQFTNYRLQFFVPLCPADGELFRPGVPGTFTGRHYRPDHFGLHWPFGETQYMHGDWSGSEPVQTSATATFHVDRAVPIGDGEPGDGKSS